MSPKLIKLLKCLGIVQLTEFWQNIFRTRFATDMYLAKLNIVTKTHTETFGGYKNKHNGQSIAIIATGPSLNKYKPIDDVLNIGVNKALFFEKCTFDYLFVQDYQATKSYIDKFEKYSSVKKFYGILPETAYGNISANLKPGIIPESIILKHNAHKYYLYVKRPANKLPFEVDIDKTWIADAKSVALSAVQFALFTNPEKIYLVGCDCSSGYFDNKKGNNLSNLKDTWKELKEFATIYYPDTEIISVNPVGLKGLFTDLYQE